MPRKHVLADVLIVIVVLAIVLTWTICRANHSSEGKHSLRVGIVPWPGYAGGFLANRGFKPRKDCIFWAHDLLVSFVTLEDFESRKKALIKGGDSGGVDVIWSTIDALPLQLPLFPKDLHPRAFMQVDWSHGADAIVVAVGIKSLDQLKGKRVALAWRSPSEWLLQHSLAAAEILPEAVITIDKGGSSDARADFTANKTEAAVLWEPDVSLALKRRQGAHVLLDTASASHMIADVMVASEKFLSENPGTIKAFVEGWFEGSEAAKRDPTSVAKLLMDQDPRFAALGRAATERSLREVTLTSLADNLKLFGLEDEERQSRRETANSCTLFDCIFREATEMWLKHHRISESRRPEEVKDEQFVSDLQKKRPVDECEAGFIRRPLNLVFLKSGSNLDTKAQQVLDHVANLLRFDADAKFCVISLSTSDSTLAQARSEAIIDYLVARHDWRHTQFLSRTRRPTNTGEKDGQTFLAVIKDPEETLK